MVLGRFFNVFHRPSPYLMGTVSVLKTDIKIQELRPKQPRKGELERSYLQILLLFFQMLFHGILDISLIIQAVEAVEILHVEHSWEEVLQVALILGCPLNL